MFCMFRESNIQQKITHDFIALFCQLLIKRILCLANALDIGLRLYLPVPQVKPQRHAQIRFITKNILGSALIEPDKLGLSD